MRALTLDEMELVSGGNWSGGQAVAVSAADASVSAETQVSTGDINLGNGNHTLSGNSVSTGDIASGNDTNAANGSGNNNGNGSWVGLD
jgi:hypothetical protein